MVELYLYKKGNFSRATQEEVIKSLAQKLFYNFDFSPKSVVQDELHLVLDDVSVANKATFHKSTI